MNRTVVQFKDGSGSTVLPAGRVQVQRVFREPEPLVNPFEPEPDREPEHFQDAQVGLNFDQSTQYAPPPPPLQIDVASMSQHSALTLPSGFRSLREHMRVRASGDPFRSPRPATYSSPSSLRLQTFDQYVRNMYPAVCMLRCALVPPSIVPQLITHIPIKLYLVCRY